MSILEAAKSLVQAPASDAPAPYRRGDRITVTSPGGERFLVRVEAVTAASSGGFTVLGAIVAPRRFRSHVLSTVVDAEGFGPAVRPESN
jgi:hypothetical protein